MTTERPPIEHVIEDTVAGMSDDALAECIEDTGIEAKRLTRMVALAQHELIQRMVANDATALDTESWTGELAEGTPIHSYDDVKMMPLAELLSPDEWELTTVQPAPKWSQRYLRDLRKRGGRIKEVIEGATVTTRGAPRLRLERKA